MSDIDDALAKTATGLNEDAKAARKKKGTGGMADALDASRTHLGTEPDANVGDALKGLGEAIDRQPGAGTENYDLSEKAHTGAMDRMRAMATDAVLGGQMVFDVRDFLIDQIKARPKPWSGTSKDEQMDVAAACEHAGRELVRKIVEAIAAAGAPEAVRVLLTRVTLGDDIVIAGKVKTFEEDEEDRAVAMLHSARGKHVLLTVASIDNHSAGSRDAPVDEDQTSLGFEAGGDEDLDPD